MNAFWISARGRCVLKANSGVVGIRDNLLRFVLNVEHPVCGVTLWDMPGIGTKYRMVFWRAGTKKRYESKAYVRYETALQT